MSSQASLNAATQDRKARLAQLKSLKRKQPDEPTGVENEAPARKATKSASPPTGVTSKYLSGRNYDPSTQGPKLGFEDAPDANTDTLEKRAELLASESKKVAAEEEKDGDKPIDLFKLQPKKPTWDLKRDLERKMDRLNARTSNAIARLVREKVEQQKKVQKERLNGSAEVDGEVVGMEGAELAEAINVREMEEREEERREREIEEDDDDDT
ncbi:MAG: hypothetical protein M1820_004322 [Bogoriella megaspora]|nr:MAG: hypothetical protein M1820_004322 [Bogoriella megaspora]